MPQSQYKILAFCQPHASIRDILRKSLAESNFQVFFVGSLADIKPAIAEFKPLYYLHDWGAVDDSQSRKILLHLDKLDGYAHLIKIMIAEKITAGIHALACDVGIDFLKSYASSIGLGQSLYMGKQSGYSDLQKFARNVRANRLIYDQDTIDSTVEKAYEQYPHDEKIALEYTNLTYRRAEYTQTCRLAEDILSKNDTNIRATNIYSRALMKIGDFQKAGKVLETANFLSPNNPERLVLLGEAFYGDGDLEKALKYFEKAYIEDQENKEAVKGIGKIKFEQDKIAEVIDLFKGSLSEDEAASFFNNSAVMAVKKEKYEEAIKLYETALKALNSDLYRPTILTNMAITCRRIGDSKKAIRCLKAALKADPSHEKALRQFEQISNKST